MGTATPRPAERERLVVHDQVTMELWRELGVLVNTWTGFLKGEEYRELMNRAVELLERHGISKVLADVSQLRPLVAEDMSWTTEDWAPRAVAAGMREMAVVLPRSVFAQLSVTRVVENLGDDRIVTAQFDDVRSALAWLETPEALLSGQATSQNGVAGLAK
jgi:hypothetical protein